LAPIPKVHKTKTVFFDGERPKVVDKLRGPRAGGGVNRQLS
jgi:hypothetical protein